MGCLSSRQPQTSSRLLISSEDLQQPAPKPYPSHGVRLSYLRMFVDEYGGRKAFKGMTTIDVVKDIIKPATASAKSSYCELLMARASAASDFYTTMPSAAADAPPDLPTTTAPVAIPNGAVRRRGESLAANIRNTVGRATVFISHAMYDTNFLEVLDAVESHFPPPHDDNQYLWFNVFTINQHEENREHDFDFFAKTVMQCVHRIGRTVMVINPWKRPTCLRRAWCLWEIYCTVSSECLFEVAMTPMQRRQFLDDMIKDGVSAQRDIDKMLTMVDVEHAETDNAEDKAQMLEAVRLLVGSFSGFNAIATEALRNAVTAVMVTALQREKDAMKKNDLQHALAVLYRGHGKFDLAEPLFTQSVMTSRELLGDRNPATLKKVNELAALYESQGRYEQAEPLFKECLAVNHDTLGDRHPDTLTALSNMASLYSNQGRYYMAEPLFKHCLALRMQVLSSQHPDTLTSLNNLAILYDNQGRYDLAEQLLKECLELRQDVLGERHPDTLLSLNNVATFYEERGRKEEARKIREEFSKLIVHSDSHELGNTRPSALTLPVSLVVPDAPEPAPAFFAPEGASAGTGPVNGYVNGSAMGTGKVTVNGKGAGKATGSGNGTGKATGSANGAIARARTGTAIGEGAGAGTGARKTSYAKI